MNNPSFDGFNLSEDEDFLRHHALGIPIEVVNSELDELDAGLVTEWVANAVCVNGKWYTRNDHYFLARPHHVTTA